jgi:hypothetical protein
MCSESVVESAVRGVDKTLGPDEKLAVLTVIRSYSLLDSVDEPFKEIDSAIPGPLQCLNDFSNAFPMSIIGRPVVSIK